MYKNSSRREFIKTAGLGVAGIGMLGTSLLYLAEAGVRGKEKKVELAIATITMDGFGDMNFEPASAK